MRNVANGPSRRYAATQHRSLSGVKETSTRQHRAKGRALPVRQEVHAGGHGLRGGGGHLQVEWNSLFRATISLFSSPKFPV
jgi:hypothetical protein